MGLACNVAGTFKAQPFEYGHKEGTSPSQSVAVVISYNLLERYDPIGKSWIPWSEKTQQCTQRIWVIGKDGRRNVGNEQLACDILGWNGEFATLLTGGCKPIECAYVRTGKDDYNSKDGIDAFEVKSASKTLEGLFQSRRVEKVSADQVGDVVARLNAKRAGTYTPPSTSAEGPATPSGEAIPF